MRLKMVRNGRIIEVWLDERLSFNDNFAMLKDMTEEDLDDVRVYDPPKKIFLDRNVPLADYGFRGFMILHIFN